MVSVIEKITIASKKLAASNCQQPLAGLLCSNPKFLLNKVLEATLISIKNGQLALPLQTIINELDWAVHEKMEEEEE